MPELDRDTAREWIERWDRQQEEGLADREDRFTALIDAVEEGTGRPDPLILDDQALLVNVRGKGLVILTGCGHSGIVNVVRYATKITGIGGVYAVVGGFHLGGPAFEPTIPETVEALAAFDPGLLVPAHCTGYKATHALNARFPNAFHQSSVLTTFAL